MPYPTILPQAQEEQFILNRILAANGALLKARALGLTGWWVPDEIKFEYIAIDQFQALAVTTIEGGSSTDLQTGSDTSVTTGSTNDITNQTTTHGETVNTTDNGQTLYLSGDMQTGLQVSGSPYLDPPITLPF